MKFAGAVLVVFFGLALSGAQTPRNVWTIDLSTLAAYKSAELASADSRTGFDAEFADNDTILVKEKFVSGPHWNADNSLEPQRSNTAIFAIDAKNGTSRHFRSWSGWRGLPAIGSGSAFHPIGGGAFLTSVGNELIRLSSTLEVLARRELPLNPIDFNGDPHQDHWWILSSSRTGKALLVRSPFPAHGPVSQEGHWISVSTLEDESSISLPRLSAGGIGTLVGDSIVLSGRIPAKESVTIQKGDGPPHPLCAKCTGLVCGTFGNELIFLEARPSYLVVDAEGKVQHHGRLGGRADTIDSVSGAITNNRVAFEFGHLGRLLEETIVVLDVDRKKEILRFAANQEAKKSFVGGFVEESFVAPQLALSPDGTKLALLTGSALELFELP